MAKRQIFSRPTGGESQMSSGTFCDNAQIKLPSLHALIQAEKLHCGFMNLTLVLGDKFIPVRGSLYSNGNVRTTSGRVFNSAEEWCSSILGATRVSRLWAYKNILCSGRTILSLCPQHNLGAEQSCSKIAPPTDVHQGSSTTRRKKGITRNKNFRTSSLATIPETEEENDASLAAACPVAESNEEETNWDVETHFSGPSISPPPSPLPVLNHETEILEFAVSVTTPHAPEENKAEAEPQDSSTLANKENAPARKFCDASVQTSFTPVLQSSNKKTQTWPQEDGLILEDSNSSRLGEDVAGEVWRTAIKAQMLEKWRTMVTNWNPPNRRNQSLVTPIFSIPGDLVDKTSQLALRCQPDEPSSQIKDKSEMKKKTQQSVCSNHSASSQPFSSYDSHTMNASCSQTTSQESQNAKVHKMGTQQRTSQVGLPATSVQPPPWLPQRELARVAPVAPTVTQRSFLFQAHDRPGALSTRPVPKQPKGRGLKLKGVGP